MIKKYSVSWFTERGIIGFKNWLLQNLPAFLVLWLLRNFLVRSEYLLKRESIKFINFCSDAYGEGNVNKCRRMLTIWIYLLDRNFPANYFNLLSDSVRSTINNPKVRYLVSDTILKATKRLSTPLFDASGWYQLSRGLNSLGYCRAAWVARERSIDLSILDITVVGGSDTSVLRGIQAHLERRDARQLSRLLMEFRNQLSDKNFWLIKDGLSLLNGDCHRNKDDGTLRKLNADLFKKLILDRSVAIVGPGVINAEYGSEIDEFDTVVRLKFIGKDMLGEQKLYGSRTDISFISAIGAFKSVESSSIDGLASVALILSISSPFEIIAFTPIYELEYENFLYRTEPISGIHVLLAVLRGSPNKLKLFGFDFYTNLSMYSKKMINFYEYSSWKFGAQNMLMKDGVVLKHAYAATFALHDQVSNFCFSQNLYKAGLFDIEPYGKSILELTPYQYVERLEEMLGDW